MGRRGQWSLAWPARGPLLIAAVLIVSATAGGCGAGSASAPSTSESAAATRSDTETASPTDAASGAVASAPSGGVAAASDRGHDPPVRISFAARGTGRTIPKGFLGLSFEFQAVQAYTGADPAHINPVLVALIRNLTPGQAPVLRIGGDSTDVSYVPTSGVKPPPYVGYPLTSTWLATTGALVRTLGARMILGLNLAANSPPLAAAESRAYIATFGRAAIDALEVGNEPNIYGKLTVYHTVLGIPVPARPPGFDYADFHRQFDAVAAAAPLGLAGPALAIGPTLTPGSWVASMPGFLRSRPRLGVMTIHRYPLRNCYVPPSSRQYPTIAHLLSGYATAGLANSLAPWIAIAHGAHRQLRVDELNSVACRGEAGVSDTFASALWVTDALFALAQAGVDGVNVHTLPNAAYELFQFSDDAGRWSAQVRPVYYGLQLFAQAAPAGSRLLELTRRGPGSGLSTWATRAPDDTVRVVVINKTLTADRTVTIRPLGAGPGPGHAATVERMLAPSVTSRAGVTLGDNSYGASTSTGVLPAPRVARVRSGRGGLKVVVPHGSAALITIPAGSAR